MSRALDLETNASIDTKDLQSVYHDIVTALCTKQEHLLEIEILGKSHPFPPGCNVLVDGNSIGIWKPKLVQAFIAARHTFFKYLRNCPEAREKDLRNATAVILLMDPEHLTAANTRKRLIQRAAQVDLEDVLSQELLWVDGYLTSRLHRHTKSPTLWNHRRWLYRFWGSVGMKVDLRQDLDRVVLVAAERHPKNYYAWSHLRWLLKYHGSSTCEGASTNLKDSDQASVVGIVRDWSLRHPGDTSGFSFLLSLFSVNGSSDGASNNFPGRVDALSVCDAVLRLTVSFKWTHESIWVFLRTLVASGQVMEEQRDAFFQAIEIVQKKHSEAQAVLQSARTWCLKYERKMETQT